MLVMLIHQFSITKKSSNYASVDRAMQFKPMSDADEIEMIISCLHKYLVKYTLLTNYCLNK